MPSLYLDILKIFDSFDTVSDCWKTDTPFISGHDLIIWIFLFLIPKPKTSLSRIIKILTSRLIATSLATATGLFLMVILPWNNALIAYTNILIKPLRLAFQSNRFNKGSAENTPGSSESTKIWSLREIDSTADVGELAGFSIHLNIAQHVI